MNILKSIKERINKAFISDESIIFPIFSLSRAPGRTNRELLSAYSQSPWLQAVVRKVSQSFASINWELYITKKGEKAIYSRNVIMAKGIEKKEIANQKGYSLEEIEEHPLLSLLDNGNQFLSGVQVRFLTQGWLSLVGEAYWVLVRNKLGVPVEIYPVSVTWIRRFPDEKNKSYDIDFNGNILKVEADDVIRFIEPSMDYPYTKGAGVAHSLGDEIDTDEFTAKYTKSWFYNMARPDLLISSEGLSPADTERLEAQWVNKLQGIWNSHKPFFLNKNVQIHELNKSFQDMQLVDLRRFERDAIVQTFGVPPEMLGILQSSNRATIEAADHLFSRWVLLPRLEAFRDVLQKQLIPQFDEKLILTYQNPIPEDRDFKLSVMQSAYWAFTKDEWRKLAGVEPLPDGKGDYFMMPLNLIGSKSLKTKGLVYERESKIISRWNYLNKTYWEGYEKKWIRELKKIFQKQQDEVMDKLKNMKSIQKSLDDLLFNREPYDELLTSVSKALIFQIIEDAGEEAFKELEIGVSFNLSNPKAIEWINQRSGTLIKGINDTTLEQLRKTLGEGLSSGESIPKLAQRVSEVFEEAKGYRSQVIARTETIAAYAKGQISGYESSGIVEKVQFWAALDERTCEECMMYHEQEFSLSEPIVSGLIPVHPQCRCIWIPVVKD